LFSCVYLSLWTYFFNVFDFYACGLISTFCSVCSFRGLSFLICLYIFTAVMSNSISLLSVMK
jgi:hypothetical protein